ncbi:LysR substrate-binding domain-containing protein [Rahnella inusitata]|uniref:LysR substrate-binding domain-containing protein n=1 Tax=Rahnella inusitata TaxID=58169 RepID=UPI001BC85B35|nr:LysR substrate-binding domain-containing protein [Rahnella inusitata]QUT13647.1 LysR family transcriptional regulator [Rahnella inusitata]
MQDNLNDMALFAAVVKHQGFTAAGRALGVSKSLLSRRVEALESRLGVRLLQRTSRHFSVTLVGERYAAECQKLLEQAQCAQQVIDDLQHSPRGLLRISAPVMMAETVIAPLMKTFLTRYPEITLELLAINRAVDLLEENFDVMIRSHNEPLEDSGLHRKPLGTLRYVLVASPAFIAALPSPPSVEQLSALPTLVRKTPWAGEQWELMHPQEGPRRITLTPRMVSNNLLVLCQAAADGLGIALLPEIACAQRIAQGELQHLLPEWHTPPSSVSALYASHKGQSPALRVFLDFLSETLNNPL